MMFPDLLSQTRTLLNPPISFSLMKLPIEWSADVGNFNILVKGVVSFLNMIDHTHPHQTRGIVV